MGTVLLHNIAPGDLGDAGWMQSNFAAITTQVNGNLDANNLANGGVTTVKLATTLRGWLRSADGTVRRATKGATGISTPGGEFGPLAFAHSLPVTPSQVILTGFTGVSGVMTLTPSLTAIDATYFWALYRNQPGIAIDMTMYWLAIE